MQRAEHVARHGDGPRHEDTFAAKNTEFRDRIAQVRLQLETCERHREENGEIALKAFELSQTLREKCLAADYRAKRRLLDIVCLNFRLEDVSLVPTIRKPFDVLAERPVSVKDRSDWTRLELFAEGAAGLPQRVAEALLAA